MEKEDIDVGSKAHATYWMRKTAEAMAMETEISGDITDSEAYIGIVKMGNYDSMYDFAIGTAKDEQNRLRNKFLSD